MSAFEFFFSFYGLLLGLSVAVLATGVATAIQHRKTIRIGRLTPLLALFVALDIASFWDFAWTVFRDVPFSYGLLVVGLVIALVYFVAASLVFPHQIEDGLSLDDHFKANRKLVLILTTAANVLAVVVMIPEILQKPGAAPALINYGVTVALYVGLVLPAAFTRRKSVFMTLTGIHIGLYLILAVISAFDPSGGERLLNTTPEAMMRGDWATSVAPAPPGA